jgi:hypothetical protein
MIPEGPFLFAVSGVSLSLAGLAGLVATLRRSGGGELSALDRFRLREIVEFSFANALFALALVPMAGTMPSIDAAVRALSVAVVVYEAAFIALLLRRQRARGLPISRSWAGIVGVLNLAIVAVALVGTAVGAVAAYEWLLLLLVSRPMVAFVAVLVSFERPTPDRPMSGS